MEHCKIRSYGQIGLKFCINAYDAIWQIFSGIRKDLPWNRWKKLKCQINCESNEKIVNPVSGTDVLYFPVLYESLMKKIYVEVNPFDLNGNNKFCFFNMYKSNTKLNLSYLLPSLHYFVELEGYANTKKCVYKNSTHLSNELYIKLRYM